MKIKNIIILSVTLLALYLYLDCKTYYYGLGGCGFLSSKLPPRFEIYFGGSDFGNQGMILMEKDMNLLIIRKSDSISTLDNSKNKIIVNKFTGYWFDDKTIVAKIKDKSNINRYIQVYEEVTNNLYPKFICKEINYAPNKLERLKYVDLDKSLNYFKRIKLFKNISLILSALFLIYFFRVLYKSKK